MLKNYNNIKDLARAMRTIKRQAKPLAANLSDNLKILAAVDDVIKIRGAKPSIKTDTKLTREQGRGLAKNNAELNTLIQHQREINNILNTLQNEFENTNYPDKDKLIAIAKRLANNISDKVDKLKVSISIDAHDTLPDILASVSNILGRSLDKEVKPLAKSSSTTSLASMIKDQPQHTLYFIYKDVEDDKGEISPSVVIALSHFNGSLFINPDLHDVIVPGKFKLGFPLKSGTPTQMAQLALKEINNQLAADGMLSGVTGHPVPFTKSKLSKIKTDEGIKMSFNPEGDALLVAVNQKMTEAKVQELANKITIKLHSLITADKSLPKMSIKYTKRKKDERGLGWMLSYKFVPDGKYTGKTLDEQNIAYLRNGGFSEDEIHSFLMALQK